MENIKLSELKNSNQSLTQSASYQVGLTNSQGFELAQRAAKLLSSSSLVPKEFQNNLPNCVVALNMANRMHADPLMVMQNLYIVHGRPSWSSKFKIATVNTCGRFSALRFEFFGTLGQDDYGCRAYATELSTGDKLVGTDITIAMAKAEGWYQKFDKNGNKIVSKWQTMTQKMLMYRAGSWWVDLYAPEISMGLMTDDEVRDIIDIDSMGQVIDENKTTIKKMRKKAEQVIEVEIDNTITNTETGEITEFPTIETNRTAIDYTADQMNGIMDLMPNVQKLLNEKSNQIAELNSKWLNDLHTLIDKFFVGYTLAEIQDLYNFIESI